MNSVDSNMRANRQGIQQDTGLLHLSAHADSKPGHGKRQAQTWRSPRGMHSILRCPAAIDIRLLLLVDSPLMSCKNAKAHVVATDNDARQSHWRVQRDSAMLSKAGTAGVDAG